MKKIFLIPLVIINLFSLVTVGQNEKVIIQLRDASQDSFWYPLTDSVRFGTEGSTAFMGVDWENAVGSFFGELKINDGSGFASYRNVVDLNVENYKRLQFRVKGDGREFKVILKDKNAVLSPADYSYQAEFKTLINEEQIVSLELADFKPVYRGQVDTSQPKLEISDLREIGLQINDGIAGPYKLEFGEWIVQQ
jgi:NADH dehydrogenase [ubiquinone] 1 alpha subcomplex assembly factor 1